MRIAFLSTRERLSLIASIRGLGDGREYPPPASFDPDAPASFGAHQPCAAFAIAACLASAAFASAAWPAPGATVAAWVGEAIEIKPATTATLERYVPYNPPLA